MSKKNNVELWKSSLMTMPDTSFFELFRTVFGKIKTPFNKQQLLNDLEKFLLRPDIQKTIAAFIDTNDEKIIAAVALFGEPTPEELERFFADEFSFVQLHDIIVNLEERFILYRFKDGESKTAHHLALNPVLDKVLAPVAANVSVLFPSTSSEKKEKQKKSTPKQAVLNDRVLAGLLSFVSQYEGTAFYKKEGQLRKQAHDSAKTCFPDLNIEETLGALQVLGLFRASDEYLYCEKKRFADIASLSARERMEYCAAALLVYKDVSPIDIQAAYYKNRIKEAVNFIHSLIDSLIAIYKDSEKEDCFSEKTIIKLIEVHKSRSEYTVNTSILLDAINKTGLTVCANTICAYNNHSTLPCITIDSGFSIFVYPEIAFSDAIELAGFLNIKEAGAVVRFELEKSSAVRAYDNGITAQHIIELLTRLSGKKLPDTLAWNIKDWEKRHGEVSLKKGVVLTLAKDKHYLAQTSPLSTLITETLAPGVYLLNENAEEEAAAALHSAGIDIIKRGKNTEKKTNSIATSTTASLNYYPVPSTEAGIFSKTLTAQTDIRKSSKKEKVFDQSSSRAVLEKMPLSKADRDELTARIDRRLILCEAQLKDANIRFEKLEARHMDYAGKQNIAKQAIAQGSPVEVVYPSGKSSKQIYGIPTALEKEGTDLFLVVNPAGKDDEDAVRIPLAKISLLRRIKKSIFEV